MLKNLPRGVGGAVKWQHADGYVHQLQDSERGDGAGQAADGEQRVDRRDVLVALRSARPEAIRAIWCSGSALRHNPR